MAGAGGTPLRLKDLLELDCDSCSAAGFRCYPRRLGEASAPMRHLLESPSSLRRCRTSSKLSHLSRSLSRRLSRRGGGFWSRRRDNDDDGEDAAAAATATAASAGCSGSGICEELDTSPSSETSSDNSSERTSRRSRSESDSVFSSATEASEDSDHRPSSQAAGAGDEHEVAMKRVVSKEGSSGSGSEADDKEQLSPVAVMDFPFDDEDEDDESRDADDVACYPSFSLARLQRRKTHKIRRFGSHDDKLTPLDLEARLATMSSDPDGPGATAVPAQAQQQMIQHRTGDADAATTPTCTGRVHDDVPDKHDNLISLLMGMAVSTGLDDASGRLLLDFFVEMKRRRSEACAEAEFILSLPGPAAGGVLRRMAEGVVVDRDESAVAAAARGWLEGTGTDERWGLREVLSGGATIVAEMDRGRRWMQVGEEELEVGAVVAGMLADQIVGEVVWCLFE